MSILERLTALLAPDDCLGCGREGSLLCNDCQPLLPSLVGRCFGCRRPVAAGAGCTDCLQAAGLDGLSCAADYSGSAKALVGQLKFRGNQSAARLIASCLAAQCTLPPGVLLVNMPATTSHVRQRGFDQGALIAKHLARLSGRPYVNALRRSGQHHQLGADRAQRLQQMTAALSVRANVRGHHVVIIDDVLTTGSSLQAAARTLRAAGAQRVEAMIFAQSISPAESPI